MQGVMFIKVVLNSEDIPISPFNKYFPFLKTLPQIFFPPPNIKIDVLSYNMCTLTTDANYNELCSAVSRCNSGCSSLRKVVSHVFGRNKTCTMQIPEACAVSWCRQHYQRFRYRSKENWINIQIDIIRRQLDRMEEWKGVTSWTITWGKSEKETIDVENAVIAQRTKNASQHGNVAGFTAINQTATTNAIEEPIDENQAPTSSVRFLLTHIGTKKTFDQVRAAIDDVEKWSKTPNGCGKHFPQIEFLPDIDQKLYPPTSGRKKCGRRKPLDSTAVESSSTPAVVSASTTSPENSLESPRKNPTRAAKRSHSNAFEDEATHENANTKTDSSTKASRLTATPKATIGRKGSQKGPAKKKGKQA